jgi:hypothetical protein
MLPGPDQIIACPNCQGLAKHGTLRSGYIFGARTWTDGKRDLPMLPQPSSVVKCLHCNEFYWRKNAEKIGLLPVVEEHDDVDPDWKQAVDVSEPSEDEYYQAIERGLATTTEEEKNLRILAWWRRNDAHREQMEYLVEDEPETPSLWIKGLQHLTNLLGSDKNRDIQLSQPPTTPETPIDDGSDDLSDAPGPWQDNLRALAEILVPEDDSDRLMKAELFRQLGDFEAAMAMLDGVESDEVERIVGQLQSLCDAQNTRVKQLNLDG